jgi:hypothetical protein
LLSPSPSLTTTPAIRPVDRPNPRS